MRNALILGILALTFSTCDSGGGAEAPDVAPADVPAVTDTTADARSDAVADASPDLASDLVSDAWTPTPSSFPQALPFTVERPPAGTPLSPEEVTAFTEKMMSFYKETGYFDWLWWTTHGLDASHDPGMFDYKLFWQDTQSIKEGDVIRFVHTGGADNLALRTAKLMNNVCAGYLMTGDPRFGRLVEAWSKGFVALSLGLEWASENPVIKYLQARAVFTVDHEYEMDGGRKVKVEYGPVKEQEKYDWNASTVPNDENPHWGPIWVRTMRSKDDVPHMYRMVPMLRRVAEVGKDEQVREAAALALEYMEGFAKDIVDQGYQIRTKEDGVTFVPTNDDGTVKDLASFVLFDPFFPKAECNAKLASALIAYDGPLDNECGEASWNMWEDLAIDGHYFNLAIIRYFHLSSLANALTAENVEIAEAQMAGVIKRADAYMNGIGYGVDDWAHPSDLASWLLAAAATGMPLTDAEAQHVADWYTRSVDHYSGFDVWDPWGPAVPDGAFNYKPDDWSYDDPEVTDGPKTRYVRLTEMSFILEYCWSPYRNGAKLLDCDVVRDPSRW